MTARSAALLSVVLLLPALAGCTEDAPGAGGEPLDSGRAGAPVTSGTSTSTTIPKSTSERWHFHDYWRGEPTITLADINTTLNATVGGDGLPALSALVSLPNGVVVPPETGFLTINVSWATETPGLLNLTYRPADSSVFLPAGDLEPGAPFDLPTTESNCDVPHRQQSAWLFNFTAKPGGTPPALPPRDVRVTIQATIGRPLFIDPPHLDWWMGMDTLPLVFETAGDFNGVSSEMGNLTVPDPTTLSPQETTPATFTRGARVLASEGRIVPEGTETLVAVLNWTSDVPDRALTLRYSELNLPSEGAMDLLREGEGQRVFTLQVRAPMTDTTYSNRTSWEFQVLPEGNPGAFHGSFTLVVWATKLNANEAATRILG